jgi:molybdopterin synthase catalytic subunit
MQSQLVIARISDTPIDLTDHVTAVTDPAAGAVATFLGQVRDHDPDVSGTVTLLEYEAHPDATATLHRIAGHVIGERPVRVAVSHRVGSLEVGDVAVVIAVASAHRALAFDVCRDLIEAIKTDLPIWKRQVDQQGRASWTGIGEVQPPANGGSTSASTASSST